jgi:hypothetical protein
MRNSALLALLGAGLAAGFLAVGCGDDVVYREPALRLGGEGESCTRSADCEATLSCHGGFCLLVAKPDGGGGSGATGPILSGEGESCTRTADCSANLVCIQQTCASEGTSGDAGMPPGPRLGQRGESCEIVSDCAAGLTCVLRSNVGGGVCDLQDYGLAPTGKSCVGECAKPEDCCELPPTGVNLTDSTGVIVAVLRSCADIVAQLGGATSVCNPAPAAGTTQNQLCFYHATYCNCAAGAWACDQNRCSYATPCQVANGNNAIQGCPTAVRSGGRIHPSCDAVSSRCRTPVASQCTTDASCNGLTVAELDDNCSANECTCVQSACYRKCNEDLDCPARYRCDTTEEVCVQEDSCTTNPQCAIATGDVRAECREGKCVEPCTTDHECSGSGLPTGGGLFLNSVCSAKGICEPVGCASDAECTTGTVRTFCVEPTTATVPAYRSAIAD